MAASETNQDKRAAAISIDVESELSWGAEKCPLALSCSPRVPILCTMLHVLASITVDPPGLKEQNEAAGELKGHLHHLHVPKKQPLMCVQVG